MLFKTISYIQFLIRSTNQHGVHSPFVYNFITKGLYTKEIKNNSISEYSELKKLSKKEQKVFSKIIAYFKIDQLYFDVKSSNKSEDKEYKIIYFKTIEKIQSLKLNTFKTKDILIIHGIHQQKKTTLRWQEIIKSKEAKVTIDLFYFGLIFFRKEQVKEHFNIRV
ncbi:hypothetical protein BST83_08090 [Polaribacter filamentus]|jgi:hypothetical protein|uniref:Uncharacterized protein n=1 Tax=Polaribacter filamentus TaxID=53483 RepID=A0A2S7KWW3_9FLAO|nr:hypothetical protein [Polaribacter filamentus]PQB07110.1 hypothetical protein BST83_08090 [Polaribacter filamentus]